MSKWCRLFTLVLAMAMAMAGAASHLAVAAEFTFSWSANPPPVTGYRLYYKKEGLAGPPFYGTDAAEGPSPLEISNSTAITISGLDNHATYHFALTAFNGDLESEFSETITVHPGATPDPNTALNVQIINMLLLLDEE